MALDGQRLIKGHNYQLNSVSAVEEILGKARDRGERRGAQGDRDSIILGANELEYVEK